MILDLKRTFTQKIEAADNSITVQFFNININITVKLPAHLYAASCSKIAAKINEHLIQTLLNAESEINMINHKIAEICDIPIHCEVTFEMQTVDSGKAPFYSCAEDVEMKMADIISILFIFVAERVENKLIFEHFWKQAVEANIFSQADESVQWIIHSSEKKIMFLNCFSEATLLCAEKNVFSAILN